MIVSLDCSTLTLSLALLRPDGVLVEERKVGPPLRQSEILPGEIEKILSAHQLTLKDVTGFVVGLGPGSFTGLRVGLQPGAGLGAVFGFFGGVVEIHDPMSLQAALRRSSWATSRSFHCLDPPATRLSC